jgi:2-polyprenyl-3-methyl-5-hydroxy-6-metoxy-1,4-benzoquinol methylase
MAEMRVCDHLCDAEPVEKRELALSTLILPDIVEKSKGLITLELFITSLSTVDIGCGRGAVGRAMRKLGNNNLITGVDIEYPYSDNNAYTEYTNVFEGDVRSNETIEKIRKINPDLIIGVGLPEHINNFVLDNINLYRIKPGGKLILATEYNLMKYLSPWMRVFKGETFVDRNILFFEKTQDEI